MSLKGSVSSRYLIYKKNGETVEKTCAHCGHVQNYHVNDIYASFNRIALTLLYLFFGATSYFLTSYMYDTYWREDLRIMDKSIMAVFSGFILPIIIAGIFYKTLKDKRDFFNAGRIPS